MLASGGHVADGAEAKLLTKRFEHRAIAACHRHLKDEPTPRCAVGVRLPERRVHERAFASHEPAEGPWRNDAGGGAGGLRTRCLIHAMDALYQLSYGPKR